MKLLTKAIEAKFKASPLYTHDGKPAEEVEVIVKFFNPFGAGTWYITEATQEGDDWRMFGFCHIQDGELGYVMLSELQQIKLRGGLGLERDLSYKGTLADAKNSHSR